MPVTKSAKKALRLSLKRRQLNLVRKKKIKLAIKEYLKAITEKNTEVAKQKLSYVYKLLDKASKVNLIHRNESARRKSRLAKLLARITDQKS